MPWTVLTCFLCFVIGVIAGMVIDAMEWRVCASYSLPVWSFGKPYRVVPYDLEAALDIGRRFEADKETSNEKI